MALPARFSDNNAFATTSFLVVRRILLLLLALAGLSACAPAFARDRTPAPPVAVSELPPEVRHTLSLIERGGPFPFRRDGAVFANREGRLPPRPRGYYREYTVAMPGAPDRGARRIVAGTWPGGRPQEYYYTDDHYRSFRRIRK